MNDMERWIAAYLAMDQRAKEENLLLMEAEAKEYPCKVVVPLRLVANNPGH